MRGHTLLLLGNRAMLVTLLVSLLAAIAAYGMSEQLAMHWQVAAHLMLLVLPVFLKLGYIMRLTALQQLDKTLVYVPQKV